DAATTGIYTLSLHDALPIFGFFLWNEGDLALQNAEQAMHGVARNPLMWPAALLEAGVLPWLPAFVGLFLRRVPPAIRVLQVAFRSEEHTSELQSRENLVCRL